MLLAVWLAQLVHQRQILMGCWAVPVATQQAERLIKRVLLALRDWSSEHLLIPASIQALAARELLHDLAPVETVASLPVVRQQLRQLVLLLAMAAEAAAPCQSLVEPLSKAQLEPLVAL
jgi:hypothetical protein